MLEIIICTVLMGAPNSSETCFVQQSRLTVETTCDLAGGFALAKGRRRRVTYCALFTGQKHS